MRTYSPEEWKILSHFVLSPNMDWDLSALNFTSAEYVEYDKWLEKLVSWLVLQNMLYTL